MSERAHAEVWGTVYSRPWEAAKKWQPAHGSEYETRTFLKNLRDVFELDSKLKPSKYNFSSSQVQFL